MTVFARHIVMVLFLQVCLSTAGFSQTRDDDLAFKRFDVAQGLSSVACGNIYRDTYGFLWVSNYYGISIFDGTRFINLPMYSSDSAFYLAALPHSFLQIDAGRMLIACPNGIYSYQYNTNLVNRLVNQPLQVTGETLTFMGKSDDGQSIYCKVGNSIHVLSKDLVLKKSFRCENENSSVFVRNENTASMHFYYTLSGHLLGLNLESGSADTLLNLGTYKKGIVINGDQPDAYLVCTANELYLFNRKTLQLNSRRGIPGNLYAKNFEPRAASLDSSGNYWIGGVNCLMRFVRDTDSITNFCKQVLDATGKEIFHIADIKTKKDNLFISTASSGLLVTDAAGLIFENYKLFPGGSQSVFSMTVHGTQLLCTSEKPGVTALDLNNKKNGIVDLSIKDLPAGSIVQLESIDEDNFWLIMFNDFKLGVANSKLLKASFDKFPIDSISLAYKQSFGSTLTRRDLLPIIKKTAQQTYYYAVKNKLYHIEGSPQTAFSFKLVDSISADYCISSINGLSAGITVGTTALEVYQLQNKKLVKKIKSINANTPARAVLEDKMKNTYVLTTNGVFVYDRDFKFRERVISMHRQMSSNIIYAGFIDAGDVLWLSTNGGVVGYDCSTRHLYNIPFSNNISNFEFNTRSFAVDERQTVFFGGADGITTINTRKFAKQQQKSSLYFSKIQNQDAVLYNQLTPGSIAEEISFPYNKSSFTFLINAITPPQVQAFEYHYLMEGLDTAWRILDIGAAVQFNSLKPGKYKFRVQEKDLLQRDPGELSYSFEIRKPFWEELLFRLLVAAIAASFIALLVLYIIRKKLETERIESSRKMALKDERERISQELHDDLGTGLTSIRLLSKSIIHQPDSVRSPQMLHSIGKISEELIDQMSEIIWVLNHTDDSFDGLVSHLRVYMAGYLQRTHLPMKLDMLSTVPANLHINNTERRNILLTIKEAFHNAVKHSQASVFSIRCSLNDVLRIVVSDNGIGMPQQTRPGGNGLHNIKKRIATINGTVNFENLNGTSITIDILRNR